MKNLAVMLVVASVFGGVAVGSGVKLMDSMTESALVRDATESITEESVRERAVRTADTRLFGEPTLDDLIDFDPSGYEAVGERPDLGEAAPAFDEWHDRFLRWTHLTGHAIFELRFGREFAYCVVPERHRD